MLAFHFAEANCFRSEKEPNSEKSSGVVMVSIECFTFMFPVFVGSSYCPEKSMLWA